jgi:hypothetical protein
MNYHNVTIQSLAQQLAEMIRKAVIVQELMGGRTANINKTVTITDSFNGVTTTLGTVTAVTDRSLLPYTMTFTYSRTVAVPTYGCKSYPNTARIVEIGQTASTTITVCGPINLGGKTIGFWQNKNGQDIIKNTEMSRPPRRWQRMPSTPSITTGSLRHSRRSSNRLI